MQSTSDMVVGVKDDKVDRRFLFSGMAVVVILLLVGIFRHEMWRDELQAWCLARDSASLIEVHKHLLYEGHPISWYLPLFIFTRFTHDPLIMQLLNVVLMSGACYLVLAHSPFNKLQRMLFCLGYFPLFEYGIISRSYSLELLVIFAFCYFFKFRNEHPWWLFSTLVLLASVNAYGLMIAFAFTGTLLLEYWLERKTNAFPIKIAAIGSVLVLVAAGLTVQQMSAPADGFHGELSAMKEKQPNRFFKAVRAIPIAYAPIPNVSVKEFWNTDEISKIESEPVIYALVVSLVVLSLTLLCTKPAAMFLYSMGTGGLVYFSFTHLLGGLRQQGHLFLILVSSFWIANYLQTKTYGQQVQGQQVPSPQVPSSDVPGPHLPGPHLPGRVLGEQGRSNFLTVVLLLQLIAGVYAYYQDLVRPFSSAKLVARFIKEKGLADMLIIGSNDHEMTSVSGYLNRKIFCPESKTYTGFVVNNTSRHNIEFEELSRESKNVMNARHVNEALLILNYPLGAIPSGFKVDCLNQFDKSIQGDERFYVYRITRESNPGNFK